MVYLYACSSRAFPQSHLPFMSILFASKQGMSSSEIDTELYSKVPLTPPPPPRPAELQTTQAKAKGHQWHAWQMLQTTCQICSLVAI
jgi:hypothetical protein